MPSPIPSADDTRWAERSKNPGSDEKWTQDAASVSQPLLRKPLATGWRRGEGLSLTKQLITIAPVVGIPGGLYGRHTSTPFLIQGRGGKAARGEGGDNFNKWGCFVHTRAGSEVFWLNSVSLEMHQVGGKGELF